VAGEGVCGNQDMYPVDEGWEGMYNDDVGVNNKKRGVNVGVVFGSER